MYIIEPHRELRQYDNALPIEPFIYLRIYRVTLHAAFRNNNPLRTTLKSPGWAQCCNGNADANEIRITLILATVHARLKSGRATIGENVAFTFFPMDSRPHPPRQTPLLLTLIARFSNKHRLCHLNAVTRCRLLPVPGYCRRLHLHDCAPPIIETERRICIFFLCLSIRICFLCFF